MLLTKKKTLVIMALGLVLGLVSAGNVGLAETQSQGEVGAETYVDPGFDLRDQVLIEDETVYVYEGAVGIKPCMIVTDEYDNIITDLSLSESAGSASMLYYRHTSDPALEFNRKQQKNIEEFLKWETAAQVALFFRDSASRALVDVGVIYMTGDTSQLTKAVAKNIVRSALRDTVEDMIKNPDNYLRAIAVKLCKDAGQELKAIESVALSMRGKEKIDYEELKLLEARAREAYSKIVPAMGLITALRPGADVTSQIKDVLGIVKDRLQNQIPGDFELLTEEKTETMYESLGSLVNEVYQHYKPYKTYLEEKSRYETMINEGYSRELSLIQEKLNNGLELVEGYAKFSATPPPSPEEVARQEKWMKAVSRGFLAYARAGDVQKVQMAIEEGVDLNVTDEEGNTALMLAAGPGHDEVVELLLSSGADIEARNRAGETALMRANSDKVVRRLLLNGANVGARNSEAKTALYLFLERHERRLSSEVIRTARRLINAGADINGEDRDGRTLLLYAAGLNEARDGNTDLAKLVVQLGADVSKPDARNRAPLMVASGFGKFEIVDLLLAKGVQVNAKDIQGRTALMYAAGHNEMTNNTQVIERLIAEGANIEVKDEDGRIALMYAVARCNLDEVEFLLEKGADPLATDSDGRTIFELDVQYQANLFETDWYERDSEEDCTRLANLLAELKATAAPLRSAEIEETVTQHLGTITFSEAPRTWTITVPEDFEKVEVATYGYGKEDEQHMYGGWNAWLKVNGEYAWKFTRFDQELGHFVHDYLKGEEIRGSTGKDSYYDITSMVTPGENTITYYHYTAGPGIGVKVRIHRSA